MKKCIITSINMFLLLQTIFAQNTPPFVSLGNQWYMCEAIPGTFGQKRYYHFKINKDSLIGGIQYHRLEKIRNNNVLKRWWLRGDSAGNVHMLTPELYGKGPNQDFMLYKFDAQPNDSMIFWRRSDNAKIKYVVKTGIQQYNTFGQIRRFIPVLGIDNPYPFTNDIWIEGIGTSRSPIGIIEVIDETTCTILCFNNFGGEGIDCMSGTESFDEDAGWVVSPNPATGTVSIRFQEQAQGSCIVFNGLGAVVHQSPEGVSFDPYLIKVGAWQPGIYCVQLRLKDRVMAKWLVVGR